MQVNVYLHVLTNAVKEKSRELTERIRGDFRRCWNSERFALGSNI